MPENPYKSPQAENVRERPLELEPAITSADPHLTPAGKVVVALALAGLILFLLVSLIA